MRKCLPKVLGTKRQEDTRREWEKKVINKEKALTKGGYYDRFYME